MPISVSYCDRTDCVRVFRGTESGKALSLQTGGFMDGHLALRIDGVMYAQSAKTIPLADHEFVRSTWGEWKAEHPATRVYLGHRKDQFLTVPGTGGRS